MSQQVQWLINPEVYRYSPLSLVIDIFSLAIKQGSPSPEEEKLSDSSVDEHKVEEDQKVALPHAGEVI